jgi:putative tryptophan/tyrosine transport system substrate-binding protein
MRRREFLAGLAVIGSWAALPRSGHAASNPLRVGTASAANPRTASFWVAFEHRMHELGYVEGQNFSFEFLDMQGQTEYLGEAMKELVRRNVDVIIASGPEVVLKAAVAATSDLPILMVAVDYDPLALGYVGSLARPTGNVTGLFFQQIELGVKRLQVMKEAFPSMEAATVFWDHLSADQWQAVRDITGPFGVRLTGVELRDQPYDYEWAIAEAPSDHRRFLIVMASPIFFRDRDRIAESTIRHRVASMTAFRGWVDAGCLMSYGASLDLLFQRVAEYVDRIAKGAKPADLPVEQPTKFELVINLKTARSLGLDLPPTLLARADEVIE